MVELGLVEPADAAKAQAKPLGISKDVGEFKEKVEPFFVYYIRNLILDNADGEFDAFGQRRIERVHTLYQGGLNIYTSLDPRGRSTRRRRSMRARPSTRGGTARTSRWSRSGPPTARSRRCSRARTTTGISTTWSGAGPGRWVRPSSRSRSTAAFEQGFPPGKVYSSRSPLCNLEGWRSASGCVSNAEGGGDSGYLDLWSATQDSVNVVFAQLALDVGPEHIVDAAHRMGITVPLDAVPSITLGVEEVPTMDMAAAFGTLANDGKRCNAWAVRRVEFANVPKDALKDERVLYQHEPECEQVIQPEIAHPVTAMLQRGVLRDRHGGELGRPVAGKTGTAQDYTNVYFAGYTPQVSTAVWVGFPNGQIPMDIVLRRLGVRWHRGRTDLARLHGQGDGGLPGRGIRGPPAARERDGARRRGTPGRGGGEQAGERELHADP